MPTIANARAVAERHTAEELGLFGGAVLLFFTYLFVGDWLVGCSPMLQSFDALRYWQDVIWVGGAVLGGIVALTRSVFGRHDQESVDWR